MDWNRPYAPVPLPATAGADLRTAVPYSAARRATEIVAWADYAATAETGDIVLFSGDSLISAAIKVAEGFSNWSHMAMVVREGDAIRLLESTNADGQIDLLSGQTRGGVRLVDAAKAIRAYVSAGEFALVAVRRLYIDERVLGTALADPVSRLPKLRAFIEAARNLPYERNPVELVRATARGLQLVYAWRSQSSYFCSELVAQAYMVLGLLPDVPAGASPFERHSGLYVPRDFAAESQDLPFLYDRDSNESLVALGPQLALVFPAVDGADPMATAPRRMRLPARPQLRYDTPIESGSDGSSRRRYEHS